MYSISPPYSASCEASISGAPMERPPWGSNSLRIGEHLSHVFITDALIA